MKKPIRSSLWIFIYLPVFEAYRRKVRWIVRDSRTLKYKDRFRKICENYRDKVLVCKNRKDVENLKI